MKFIAIPFMTLTLLCGFAFAETDCVNRPQTLTVELRGTNGDQAIDLIFKHDGGRDYYGCLDSTYSLKYGFLGDERGYFDRVYPYGGYIMIDIDKLEVWEGTQGQALADSRGNLRHSHGDNYVLYDPVDMIVVTGKNISLFGNDTFLCMARNDNFDYYCGN